MLQFTGLHIFVVLAACLCVASAGFGNKRELEEIPVIVPERACLSAGGHCVHESRCPADKINAEVECLEQKAIGAVCCHSAHPPDESRCEYLAGECKAECPENLKVTQATNCAEGEVCCTLV